MQTANIYVKINEGNSEIPKYGVTPSEIAVLEAIHGAGAVFDVEPTGDIDTSDRDEKERLSSLYGRSVEGTLVAPEVDRLFPGVGAKMLQSLKDLSLQPEAYKAEKRMTADTAAADPLDGMTKAELVAYAKDRAIDIDPNANKPEILTAIRAADKTSAFD